jgi:hypothetical protein
LRQIDFFLDPMCPFCWITSKWIRMVREPRDLEVTWRFISLQMLNEDNYDNLPEGYRNGHARGLEYLRVAAAVREAVGNQGVGEFYEALGNAIWETAPDGATTKAELMTHHVTPLDLVVVLKSVGLDGELAMARSDEGFDDLIRKETGIALERAGKDVGTPIISFDPPNGPAFFGPVISKLPADQEQAVALWDALSTMATFPGFAELKTSLRAMPDTALLNRHAALPDGA